MDTAWIYWNPGEGRKRGTCFVIVSVHCWVESSPGTLAFINPISRPTRALSVHRGRSRVEWSGCWEQGWALSEPSSSGHTADVPGISNTGRMTSENIALTANAMSAQPRFALSTLSNPKKLVEFRVLPCQSLDTICTTCCGNCEVHCHFLR